MPGTTAPTPAARLIRGWLCAALATFLAASSHAIAGGEIPVVATLVALSLGALVCVLLAGRRLSLSRVIAAVAVSQVVFHVLFDMFSTSSPRSATSTTSGGTAGVHQHDPLLSSAPVVIPDHVAGMAGADTGMMISHVLAGMLSVAVIRRGEQLWWALMSALQATVTLIVRLVSLCPVTPDQPRPTIETAAHGLYELLHADSRLRLRGPPATRPASA